MKWNMLEAWKLFVLGFPANITAYKKPDCTKPENQLKLKYHWKSLHNQQLAKQPIYIFIDL